MISLMKKKLSDIGFSLFVGLMPLLSWLPFWALYLLSDLTYTLLYYIVRYRRPLVDKNLRESFPGMSAGELAAVRRRFYLNFSDYIFETAKLLHVSDAQMRRLMTFTGVDLTDAALREGRPVVVYFSHCGNWEWVPSFTLWSGLQPGREAEFCQIYRPLRNRRMDALMLKLRSRFGSVSLAKNMAFLDLMRYRKRGIPTITGFMSDQKPSHGDQGVVVDFLHHPTAMISGTETVARRMDALVVYWDMSKPSRGHYHIDTVVITDAPKTLAEGEITRRYAALLEQSIRRQPPIWLWSHNRWKNPVKAPVMASDKSSNGDKTGEPVK